MVKTAALSFRIADAVKAGLERAAAAEDRSVSNLVERILQAWLVEQESMAAPGNVESVTPSSEPAPAPNPRMRARRTAKP